MSRCEPENLKTLLAKLSVTKSFSNRTQMHSMHADAQENKAVTKIYLFAVNLLIYDVINPLHVTHHDSLSKTILQGTLEGGRRRGREKKCWMDNVKEWTSLPMPELLTRASCRKDWKRICLLYTSPSPRDSGISRMPSSA